MDEQCWGVSQKPLSSKDPATELSTCLMGTAKRERSLVLQQSTAAESPWRPHWGAEGRDSPVPATDGLLLNQHFPSKEHQSENLSPDIKLHLLFVCFGIGFYEGSDSHSYTEFLHLLH